MVKQGQGNLTDAEVLVLSEISRSQDGLSHKEIYRALDVRDKKSRQATLHLLDLRRKRVRLSRPSIGEALKSLTSRRIIYSEKPSKISQGKHKYAHEIYKLNTESSRDELVFRQLQRMLREQLASSLFSGVLVLTRDKPWSAALVEDKHLSKLLRRMERLVYRRWIERAISNWDDKTRSGVSAYESLLSSYLLGHQKIIDHRLFGDTSTPVPDNLLPFPDSLRFLIAANQADPGFRLTKGEGKTYTDIVLLSKSEEREWMKTQDMHVQNRMKKILSKLHNKREAKIYDERMARLVPPSTFLILPFVNMNQLI